MLAVVVNVFFRSYHEDFSAICRPCMYSAGSPWREKVELSPKRFMPSFTAVKNRMSDRYMLYSVCTPCV